MEEISDQSGGNESCPEHIVVQTGTTHSTYKGPYPFQTVPMPKIYRILTSVDPMHFLAYSSIMGEPKKNRSQKPSKHQKFTFFCPSCKIVFLFGLLQTILIQLKINLKKNINIHVHSPNFHAKLESWIIKTEIWKIFEKKMKSPIKNWVFWEFGKIWMLRALPGIKWIPLLAAILIDDNYT